MTPEKTGSLNQAAFSYFKYNLGCCQGLRETEGYKCHFNKERTHLRPDAELRAQDHLATELHIHMTVTYC